MFGRILFCCVITLVSQGCLKTVMVKREGNSFDGVPGIPFYVKSAACYQETVYLETEYLVTLSREAEQNNKIISTVLDSRILNEAQYQGKCFQDLTDAYLKSLGSKRQVGNNGAAGGTNGGMDATDSLEETTDEVVEAWRVFVQSLGSCSVTPAKQSPVSNTLSFKPFVDYSRKYYLNSRRPLIGSAKILPKIASDGTLQEVEVNIEDKTAEVFLDKLPAGDLVSKIFDLGEGESTAAFDLQARPGFKISVTPRIYRHTLSKLRPQESCVEGSSYMPLRLDGCESGELQCTKTPVGEKKGDGQAKDKNAVSVSGTIVLPKK